MAMHDGHMRHFNPNKANPKNTNQNKANTNQNKANHPMEPNQAKQIFMPISPDQQYNPNVMKVILTNPASPMRTIRSNHPIKPSSNQTMRTKPIKAIRTTPGPLLEF
jgi:spore germination protein GerM